MNIRREALRERLEQESSFILANLHDEEGKNKEAWGNLLERTNELLQSCYSVDSDSGEVEESSPTVGAHAFASDVEQSGEEISLRKELSRMKSLLAGVEKGNNNSNSPTGGAHASAAVKKGSSSVVPSAAAAAGTSHTAVSPGEKRSSSTVASAVEKPTAAASSSGGIGVRPVLVDYSDTDMDDGNGNDKPDPDSSRRRRRHCRHRHRHRGTISSKRIKEIVKNVMDRYVISSDSSDSSDDERAKKAKKTERGKKKKDRKRRRDTDGRGSGGDKGEREDGGRRKEGDNVSRAEEPEASAASPGMDHLDLLRRFLVLSHPGEEVTEEVLLSRAYERVNTVKEILEERGRYQGISLSSPRKRLYPDVSAGKYIILSLSSSSSSGSSSSSSSSSSSKNNCSSKNKCSSSCSSSRKKCLSLCSCKVRQ